MRDFGKAPILLGRLTDDTGTIGLMGSAIAFISFAINPLVGVGIALTVANDVAHGRAVRHGLAGRDDSLALPGDSSHPPTLNACEQKEFSQVQPQTTPESSAQSSTQPSQHDRGDEAWLNDTEPTWSPPAPDLSLLPIQAYKSAVAAGDIDVTQLHDNGVRQLATDKVFSLVSSGQFANIEHVVWAVFGLTKGGNDWYAIAADFCRRCKEHFANGPSSSGSDSRVTW